LGYVTTQCCNWIGAVISGVKCTGAVIAAGTDATEGCFAAGACQRLVEVNDAGAQVTFDLFKGCGVVADQPGRQTEAGCVGEFDSMIAVAITEHLQYRTKQFFIERLLCMAHINQRRCHQCLQWIEETRRQSNFTAQGFQPPDSILQVSRSTSADQCSHKG